MPFPDVIRDYLYADLPKLAALHSQMAGANASPADDAPWERTKLPFALLTALEAKLASHGYLVNIHPSSPPPSLRNPVVREALSSALCVKVTGRAVLEDFARIRQVLESFPANAAFANRTVQASLRNSDDFRQLEMTIAAEAEQLKEDTDRASRAAAQSRIQQMKADMDEAIHATATVNDVDDWVVQGMKTWIDTMLADVVNLRIYPSRDAPDEQVMGPLKRQHFVEENAAALHFAYGATHHAPITMLGLITCCPSGEPDSFSALAEFEREQLPNAESLEKGQREVLRHVDMLAQLARNCRFPRVMVQPLLVYRNFAPHADV